MSRSPASPDYAPHRANVLALEVNNNINNIAPARRSKRDSTTSGVSKRELAAERYPSPPLGAASGSSLYSERGSRPQSIDSTLLIPPYNPARRSLLVSPTSSASTTSLSPSLAGPTPSLSPRVTTEDRNSNPQYLAPDPPSAPRQQATRPSSAAVSNLYAAQSQILPASNSRARQSVSVLPPVNQIAALSSAGPYPTLYTPHPLPRQKVYFGPYILLQTLGEGEFGKVKLGIHSERWGEEVAIKLIKRGNVDTAVRGEKVRREIEVLKAVRHPNIVRLYDVIETEKYIGIVLEYASGGELFDHILAHRYLKERDAARLFAQLVSGVGYLHSKKVVHRDLKLENLLLDRNRNVIITDFGFANRFIDSADDLMATSCGSPCYAAPELVVQEGKYVGTAVDVWSCGVILYAMLAGYLPYDDDPANPEGDNINLLYKYIINTPLAFPDWISDEPRDLLLQMLVPDPNLRCTIEDVMSHSWLSKYASTFSKTVRELEGLAQDAELTKRQMLEAQRQFLLQQQQAIMHAAAGGLTQAQAIAMVRSQSSSGAAMTDQRHRSALTPSATFSPSLPLPLDGGYSHSPSPHSTRSKTSTVTEEGAVPLIPPYQPKPPKSSASSTSSSQQNRRSLSIQTAPVSPTIQSHLVTVDATPFTFAPRTPELPASSPMSASLSAPPNPPPAALDHDEALLPMIIDTPAGTNTGVLPSPTRVEVQGRARRTSARLSALAPPATPVPQQADSVSRDLEEEQRRKRAHRSTVQVEYDGGSAERSLREQAGVRQMSEDTVMESDEAGGLAEDVIMIEAGRATPVSPLARSAVAPTDLAARAAGEMPPMLKPIAHSKPSLDLSSSSRVVNVPPPSTGTGNRHRKAAASVDRFSLRSLLGGGPSGDKVTSGSPTLSPPVRRGSLMGQRASKIPFSEAPPSTTSPPSDDKRTSRRQKAMSLQPFGKGPSSAAVAAVRLPKGPEVEPVDMREGARTRSSTMTPLQSPPDSAARTITNRPPRASAITAPRSSTTSTLTALDSEWSGARSSSGSRMGSSTSSAPMNKAKLVMDWFRRKSVRGEAVSQPLATDFDRYRPSTLSTVLEPVSAAAVAPVDWAGADGKAQGLGLAPTTLASTNPSVIVTGAPGSGETRETPEILDGPRRSSRDSSSAQGRLSKNNSISSTGTVALSSAAGPSGAGLRVHQGALDRSAVTSRAPGLVMEDLRNVLWNMGIDSAQEGEFKLKCVRHSRKRSPAGDPVFGSSSAARLSTLRPTLPASPSLISNLGGSPSVTFRSFFVRKNSSAPSTHSNSPAFSSPATLGSQEAEPLGSPASGTRARFGSVLQPLPVYGDATSTDTGDEVRFYVEITQVKNLAGLYYVDVKRMRGGVFSFKYVYDCIIREIELPL